MKLGNLHQNAKCYEARDEIFNNILMHKSLKFKTIYL